MRSATSREWLVTEEARWATQLLPYHPRWEGGRLHIGAYRPHGKALPGILYLGDLPGYGTGMRRMVAPLREEVLGSVDLEARKVLRQLRMGGGGTECLRAHLALFGHTAVWPEQSSRFYASVLSFARSLFLEDRLVPIGFTSDLLHGTSGPGYEARRRGIHNKSSAVLKAFIPACMDYRQGPFPVKAGQRGRIIEEGVTDLSDPTRLGRLVWELDVRDVSRILSYSEPLCRWMKYRFRVGSAIGVSGLGQDFVLTHTFLQREGGIAVMTDRSRFDSSLSRPSIWDALSIVRAMYDEENPEFDERWMYFYRTLVSNVIVLPDGSTYLVGEGTATGNPFVQPIQTIILFLQHLTLMAEMDGGRDRFTSDAEYIFNVYSRYPSLGLGDDHAFNADTPKSIEELSKCESSIFGTHVRPSKSWCGPWDRFEPNFRPLGIPESPFFLGNYYGPGGYPYRTVGDLCAHLVAPERSMTIMDEFIRCCSLRAVFWTNEEAMELLDFLLLTLMSKFVRLDPFSDEWETRVDWSKQSYRMADPCAAEIQTGIIDSGMSLESLWDMAHKDWSPMHAVYSSSPVPRWRLKTEVRVDFDAVLRCVE